MFPTTLSPQPPSKHDGIHLNLNMPYSLRSTGAIDEGTWTSGCPECLLSVSDISQAELRSPSPLCPENRGSCAPASIGRELILVLASRLLRRTVLGRGRENYACGRINAIQEGEQFHS